MNLSSRWCVTAVVALGAVACSDPVPPASQGAIYVTVQSTSPTPSGKACPSGASTTFDIPHVDPNMKNAMGQPVDEVLDDKTYLHWVVDGVDKSEVSCSVKSAGGGYSFSGRLAGETKGSIGDMIVTGAGTMQISNGTLDASGKGTATISFSNTAILSQPLSSPAGACTVDAMKNGVNAHQVQPGSMWASFSCSSIEAQPSDYCGARGVFVLENCAQ